MRINSVLKSAFAVAMVMAIGGFSPATAFEAPEWFENEYYKLSLNVRARVELADAAGSEKSEAYTIRTRLGLGTKPYEGLSAYAELENSVALDNDDYFDVVEGANGQTAIADPEETDLNQAFIKYDRSDEGGIQLIGGRQRIKLDDDRFIGNVGWRQNEQVYDAAQVSSSLNIEGLKLTYGYIWDVLRIFGNDGAPGLKNFDSDSHFLRAAYNIAPGTKLVGFAYLLDFDNSAGNSSNTFGARVTGSTVLNEEWKGSYAASLAWQTDAGDNPVSYDAQYVAVEGTAKHRDFGGFSLGYELLGSDDGTARFVTPLATAHKFNGFADVFLNNGGADGFTGSVRRLRAASSRQAQRQANLPPLLERRRPDESRRRD